MRRLLWISMPVLLACVLMFSAEARTAPEAVKRTSNATLAPNYMYAEHNQGKLALTVTNRGVLGAEVFGPLLDSFTGFPASACGYPKGTPSMYLFTGALWVGAVVGNDTLVSTGADGWITEYELHPEEGSQGRMVYRSTVDPTSAAYFGAVSEEDFISTYCDTLTNFSDELDYLDCRPHRPIGVEITEASYAWSHVAAEDIVLFNLKVRNISQQSISSMYLGILMDGDVKELGSDEGAQDDITGFRSLPLWAGSGGCGVNTDSLKVAWIADNDGDLNSAYGMVPHVTGVTFLNNPGASLSYNWWISNVSAPLDYGPQGRATYRNLMTGGQGTPEGDRNKYHMLRNGEIDFDQVYVASIEANDPVWMPPPANQKDHWAQGMDTRYLLSTGPLDLEPGESAPLVFAFVAGENLHTDADNIDNLPDDPDAYMAGLNFSDFDQNVRWANWIYDNPGVDTDSDGYQGEFVLCGTDTVWVTGDGVPDFHTPDYVPPPPDDWLRVEALPSALRLRWNGVTCETALDAFTRKVDFEGYNVYLGSYATNFAAVAHFDIQDFVRYYWNTAASEWQVLGGVFTFEELWQAYAQGDPSWGPLDYNSTHPLVVQTSGLDDSLFYFTMLLSNADELGDETAITKVYPDAPKPATTDPDDIPPDSVSIYLTGDGFFKYYEYEVVINNLLPTTEYRVFVTSLDNGSVALGYGAGESPWYHGMVEMTPDSPTDTPEDPGKRLPNEFALAQNYPNPFNPTTDIVFSLPTSSHVTLEVLNIAGQRVATLVDSYLSAGDHTVQWNAEGYATGVYLYRLHAGDFVTTRKMMLVK